MEYNFNSSIRGYHVYKNVWKYEIGDKPRAFIRRNTVDRGCRGCDHMVARFTTTYAIGAFHH
jgi:hypothetical protein